MHDNLQINNEANEKEIETKESEIKNKARNKNIFFIILKSLIIVLTILSIVRVPYIGVFFDSTIFTILFGYTKFIAYALILGITIYTFFPNRTKKIYTFKRIFILLIIWFSISMIISGIGIQLDYNSTRDQFPSFSDYFINNPNSFFEYWRAHDWNLVHSSAYSFYLNPRSYGGLGSFSLVILFESVAPMVLTIIVSFALIVWGCLAIKKYYTNHNFHKQDDATSVEIINSKNNEITKYLNVLKDKKFKSVIGDLNKLNDNSSDVLNELELHFKKLTNKLSSFFETNKIKTTLIKSEIMYKSIVLRYSFNSKKDFSNFNQNIETFKIDFGNVDCNYYLDKNDLIIIKGYEVRPLISLRYATNKIENNKHFNIALGQLSNRKSIYFNALNEPTTIIFGSKGSGSTMLLSNLVLSLCLFNNKHLLNVDIIDTSGKSLKNLSSLPQVNSYGETTEFAKETIDKITKIMLERENILSKNKCDNIYEYNNKFDKKEWLTPHLLVINGLEELLLTHETDIFLKLESIVIKAQNLGIILLVLSNILDESEISLINKFNNIIVLKLDTKEDSIKLLDSLSGYYLVGNGDAILKTKNNQYHFQTLFANKEEINNIMNIINEDKNE